MWLALEAEIRVEMYQPPPWEMIAQLLHEYRRRRSTMATRDRRLDMQAYKKRGSG